MSDLGPLRDVVLALDEAEIGHMVVGSIASTHYGPTRSTQDIDLVIDPREAEFERFLTSLDHERLYVPDEMARQALHPNGQFNIIDYHSPWKIDLMMLGEEPFDTVQFERRRPASIGGIDVFVASPEDTVLAKLRWHRLGGSGRQLQDVAGILEVMAGQLDEDYLDRWADELGVREVLDGLRSGVAVEDR
jgi:hypothetical protein